jgi:dTDP-glucose 4,6-dehydratase/UDP-glucose 4-epimerase
MKIFVTGATGFLGKSIVQFLPEYRYFEYVRGTDILKELNKFQPNVIIHCAAEIYDESKMFNSNVKLTHEILEWVKNNNIKLIYIGSSSEYGKMNKPMSEKEECLPCTVYAYTKFIGTLKCQEYARKYNKDITIIRPFSVYGPNEPEHRLIPTLYRNLTNNIPVNIIEGEHDFIHIIDFINFINIIINHSAFNGEIFNIGRGESFSNEEVLNKMISIISPTTLPQITFKNIKKSCDSEKWICDVSKIEKFFNFKFKYDLDSGLNQYKIYKTCQ